MNARAQRIILLSAAILLLFPFTLRARQPDRAYNKSWLWVDVSNGGKPLVTGDIWEVPVEYNLDPADHDRKTTLALWGAGPWIDTPDGKYVKQRGHIPYPGLFATYDILQPGNGRHVFRFQLAAVAI